MLFREHGRGLHLHLNRAPQISFPPFGGDDDEQQPTPTPTHAPPTPKPTPTQTRGNNQPTTPPAQPTPTPTPKPTPTTSRGPNTVPSANQNTQSQLQQTGTPSVPSVANPGATYTPPVYSNDNNAIGAGYTPGQQTVQSTGSPTPDPNGEGSGGTMIKVGYAAAALAGLAILVAGIFFLMKRSRQKREDEALGDVFDRNSFVRDSVTIPDHVDDEHSHPSERGRPRPPTMIARHLGATSNNTPFGDFNGGGGYGAPPVPAMPNNSGYYGQNGGYNEYDQYAQNGGNYGYDNNYNYGAPQPGFGAYQDSPMHSPLDPYADHTQSAHYLNHQVGGPEYPVLTAPAAAASPTVENGRSLTRQPSNAGPAVDYPNISELGRGTSVTPFQAAQYAEIGKRLDDPISPTGDPTHAYGRLDRSQPHAGQHRPLSDDAYGGI